MAANTVCGASKLAASASVVALLLLLHVATQAPAVSALQQGSRIALVNFQSGNAIGRCRNCVSGAAKPDTVFVHVPTSELQSSPWAQWDVEELQNGKIALRSDIGLYLSRCYECGSAAVSNSATVHVTAAELASSPWAQFDLVPQTRGRVALRADNGDYLALCVGCWDNVSRTGPLSDQHLFVSGSAFDISSSLSSSTDYDESSSSPGIVLPSSATFDVVYI